MRPRLPDERQRADARGDRASAEAHRHAGSRLGVLAADERERDRSLEAERPSRARDPADWSVVGTDHLGAGRRDLGTVQQETSQHPVHVPAITDPHDDLLARGAAFGPARTKSAVSPETSRIDTFSEKR